MNTLRSVIDEATARTYRYFYADGLVELAIGSLFLAVGLVLQIWARAETGSALALGIALGLLLLVLAGGFALRWAVGLIKERVTYPRTGYVSYQRREPGRGRWLIAGAALGLVVLSSALPEQFARMALFEGLLLLIVLGYMGYRVKVRRFYLLGLTAAILGVVATLLIPGDVIGSSVTFGGTGIALLLSGALTLRSYLQSHPRVSENFA